MGGPLLKNKLWIFSSYIPSIDTIRRTTNFTGANPGPANPDPDRDAAQRVQPSGLWRHQQSASVRLLELWLFPHHRPLGGQDSNIAGQLNTGASTDPNTFRSDAGSVNPLSVYSFGGDWTPTAKLVVSARYGYFFNNNEQRGIPRALRYRVSQDVSTPRSTDLAGAPIPAQPGQHQRFRQHPEQPGVRV